MILLEKGGEVDLATTAPTLQKAMIGLGWDPKSQQAGFLGSLFGATAAEYDLDASVFVLGNDGKLLGDKWFVFFNNKKSPADAVVHGGDNRTGEGDGDDEAILVDFGRLPPQAAAIDVWVTIYKARERKQSFAEVENSFARLVDSATGAELLKFEIASGLAASDFALHFVRLKRNPGGWTFEAVGKGASAEIGDVVRLYQ